MSGQWTEADLKAANAEQTTQAFYAGQLDELLGREPRATGEQA